MSEIITFLYIYCTDFTLELAHIFGISYYDVNALIFCIFLPLLTLTLFFSYLILKYRNIKRKQQQQINPKK